MSEGVAAALPSGAAQLDFVPQPPCTFDRAFIVTSVFTDVIPGSPPQPRINFVVSRQGQEAFVLSETPASVPFSAIPISTHRVRVTVENVVADGFAGPSGTGVDTAYLRWRTHDVTFELAATLRPWLTEGDVRSLAAGLIGAATHELPD